VLQLARDGRVARLGCRPDWAESHPRTLHLLRQEADAWSWQGPLELRLPG
jgi:exopolyphosphatase/guanosine-5'-triphosphate,3'-diphosphate pyrophosphatase